MSNPVTPAATVDPAQTTPTPAASSPASLGQEPPKTVSYEEHQAILKRVDSLSAAYRRIQEGKPQPTAPNADASGTPPNPDDGGKPTAKADERTARLEAELKKLRDESTAQRTKLADKSKRVAIQEALGSKGLDETDSRLLRNTIQQEFGSQIEVDDEGNVYQKRDDLDGGNRPIADLVNEVYTSMQKRFSPAVQVPGKPRGGAPGAATMTRFCDLPPEVVGKMTLDEQNAYVTRELKTLGI